MPWYAWIPIAAIVVFGVVHLTMALVFRDKESSGDAALNARLDDLERRVDRLEGPSVH